MVGVKGQDQGRAISQIHLTIILRLIVTETSNLVHILVYEKLHQL